MRIKIFTGTYEEIENNFNNLFSLIKVAQVIKIDWEDRPGLDKHVLIVYYFVD